MKFATAFISAVLLTSASGYAKDYRLDYGIETPTDGDAGSTACPYRVCRVKVAKLNLTVIIFLSRDDPDHARIQIEGKPGCCFFELGAPSQRIVPGDPAPRLRFFTGMAPQGLLYFQNEPAGNLYLRFHLD
ncbi:hypothetical protein [Bradyrhizobium sp. Cp5.3]|uniref:hypothetical protein n=1 Tax=Bradyrhizobium sp. Cp5.3 TaxID=443598 RepID=UPI0003FCAB8A|nr:hypothetical protein [Bradyrhizobium sp. Cp5.3]